MTDGLADRLRSLLASDVYNERGRLRSDDLLVRQRVEHGLAFTAERLRGLASRWRTERVPPPSRASPFPPAEVMAPLRRAERLLRDVEDVTSSIRGLPLLNPDKVWDRVRGVGLQELINFDWAMVSESEQLAAEISDVGALDLLEPGLVENRLTRLRQVVIDRRRYIEYLA
jgi:hypothetical protein